VPGSDICAAANGTAIRSPRRRARPASADNGYSYDLIWLTMLFFICDVLIRKKGKDGAQQDIRRLTDSYFAGLSVEDQAIIQRGVNDPATRNN
jgi:hypothetical protein